MRLDRSTVRISGTCPGNPKNAEDLVRHLEHVRADGKQRRTSHFVTCPDAPGWRKRK